jgi:hypothetical protein
VKRGLAPAASATFAARTTATAAAAFARNHGASFVDHQSAAQEVAPIARFNCAVCGRVVVDFDESESAGLTCKTIAHHIHAIHGDTRLRKEIRYIGFGSRIREIAYK